MTYTNGSEWLANLPNSPGTQRDQMTLEAIESGLAHCAWIPVASTVGNDTAIFHVCDDAVYVDLDGGARFRFQVTALLSQKCADAMQASLITAKVSDLAWQQAGTKLPATILPANPDMVTTSRSIDFNKALESKRAGATGLIRDCGKAWILSNLLGQSRNQAINYGFYDPHAPYINPHGIKMWQNIGTRHDTAHTDYSQTLIVMSKTCQINGQDMDVTDVMKDAHLCNLISYEGVMHYTRMPNV